MLLADTLVVIGMATVSLGTIHETDGVQQRSFWLRNDGQQTVVLKQGFTSCGCTQIEAALDSQVLPGDSTSVTLRFNPRHKGGEFHELGTVTYVPLAQQDDKRSLKHVEMALTGTCITSEETLLKQFPIRINDQLRLSTNRFDIGYLKRGQSKKRSVVVLHRDEGNRKEMIPIFFEADDSMPNGLQHVKRTVTTTCQGQAIKIDVTFDVIIN